MSDFPRMAFAHMGIYVSNPELMVEFYVGILGFCVTDRARIRDADLVFLSRNPQEHHQIVLAPGRDPTHPSTVQQISFRVVSLIELRRIHKRVLDVSVSSVTPINHGGSWSVYLADPEGNRIELFAQTPWYMPPVSVPLDFTLSDEEIFAKTELMVKASPGSMARSEWYEQTRRRMIDDGTLEQRQQAPTHLPP